MKLTLNDDKQIRITASIEVDRFIKLHDYKGNVIELNVKDYIDATELPFGGTNVEYKVDKDELGMDYCTVTETKEYIERKIKEVQLLATEACKKFSDCGKNV